MRFWEAMKALEDGKAVVLKGKTCPAYNLHSLSSDRWRKTIIEGFDKEWELYEEKEMNIYEIFEDLKAGKKFRRKAWPEKFPYYIQVDDEGIKGYHGVYWYIYTLCLSDLEASDWVEVK